MKNPMDAIRNTFRCRLCNDESGTDENPAIVKMREMNDELDSRIEERYGRDFLEDMIFAREKKAEARHVGRNV